MSKAWVTFPYKVVLRTVPLLMAGFLAFGFLLVMREAFPFVEGHLLSGEPGTWSSLLEQRWYPSDGEYGLGALVLGTLMVVALSLLMSLPLAFFAALAMAFFLPAPLGRALRVWMELCSGIPAVVVGLFGLLTLVPLLAEWVSPGFGLGAAAGLLAILLLPHSCVQLCEVLEPGSGPLLLSGQSLGFSKARTIRHIILPGRTFYLVQTALLAAARGLGETLAILMVAGNVIQIPGGLFEPFRTLNATIALEVSYALGTHRGALFFLGVVTFALVWLLRLLTAAVEKRMATGLKPGCEA